MKFNQEQFTAIAFIFERENGNLLGEFELETIYDSTIGNVKAEELEKIICNGLEEKLYGENELRISSYWALSKRFNPELLKYFRKWLQYEVDNENSATTFQLMIAIDKLDDAIFSKERTGRSFDEIEMNMLDAKKYLNNINTKR